MRSFRSSFGRVELTDERAAHIESFHPDIVSCLDGLVDVIEAPDIVVRSRNDFDVRLFYRFLQRRRKYLVVVVKVNERNFILTAYLTATIRRRT